MISGTSADGIDVACVRFPASDDPRGVEVQAFETIPYEEPVKRLILAAAADQLSLRQTALLHTQLGEVFARAALQVMPKEGCDLIASHGQTVCHLPEQNCTLQLGEAAIIASRTGVLTVSDFRTADMAVGGQGAPLVPLFDHFLLASPRNYRIAVNLGGIANITVLPPSSGSESVRAWDTGPANSVSDALCRLAGRGAYDPGGQTAARGEVDPVILADLLALPYFQQSPPKSTGLEDFGEEFAKRFPPGEPADLLRTALALSAQSLVDSVAQAIEVDQPEGVIELIFAGGGTSNLTLMTEIEERLRGCIEQEFKILRFSDFDVSEDSREAVAFAYLGDRTARGLVGTVPSTTGATQAAILGKISIPTRSDS